MQIHSVMVQFLYYSVLLTVLLQYNKMRQAMQSNNVLRMPNRNGNLVFHIESQELPALRNLPTF